MGNKKDLGYSEFDRVKAKLQVEHPDWTIISPADEDRNLGMSPEKYESQNESERKEFLHNVIIFDLGLVSRCDAVYHIKGWRDSLGFCWVEHWYSKRMGKTMIFELEKDLEEYNSHGFRGDLTNG